MVHVHVACTSPKQQNDLKKELVELPDDDEARDIELQQRKTWVYHVMLTMINHGFPNKYINQVIYHPNKSHKTTLNSQQTTLKSHKTTFKSYKTTKIQ